MTPRISSVISPWIANDEQVHERLSASFSMYARKLVCINMIRQSWNEQVIAFSERKGSLPIVMLFAN
jgi:hypothetical protein